MKGNPKYKLGDKVQIEMFDDINKGWHEGEIEIIDAYGTWDDPSDVSYDIMIHDYRHPSYPDKPGDCLIKHCTESTVLPVEHVTAYTVSDLIEELSKVNPNSLIIVGKPNLGHRVLDYVEVFKEDDIRIPILQKSCEEDNLIKCWPNGYVYLDSKENIFNLNETDKSLD